MSVCSLHCVGIVSQTCVHRVPWKILWQNVAVFAWLLLLLNPRSTSTSKAISLVSLLIGGSYAWELLQRPLPASFHPAAIAGFFREAAASIGVARIFSV